MFYSHWCAILGTDQREGGQNMSARIRDYNMFEGTVNLDTLADAASLQCRTGKPMPLETMQAIRCVLETIPIPKNMQLEDTSEIIRIDPA